MTTNKNTTPAEDDDERNEQMMLDAITSQLSSAPKKDPEEVMKRINERYSHASTIDEIFDVMERSETSSWAGRVLEIRGVEWSLYDTPQGKTVPLAEMDVTDVATLQADTFVTTSRGLVPFLWRVTQLDLFPFKARIEGKLTKSGNTTYNFKRVN